MPKFFVISDVHGFYDEMITALNNAGFDKDNEDHWLIGCGDYFDRGNYPAKVMKFLYSLPRKILVRGNHEKLLEELCEREYPYSYDTSNGTTGTVWQLGFADDFQDCCAIVYNRVKPFYDSMVNYFETKKYIFVHSWVPLKNLDNLPAHYTRDRKFDFNPDWRNASQKDWEDAAWGNPFCLAQDGFNQTGKTIVFGHWHCSTGHSLNSGEKFISEFGEDSIWEPYKNEELGIIGIDRCTAHTGEVNVLVIEDEFLEENI